jgi:hypothetical protein
MRAATSLVGAAVALLALAPVARAKPAACPAPDGLVEVARKAYELAKSDPIQLLACTPGDFPQAGYFAVFQVHDGTRPDVHSSFFARNGTLVRDHSEAGTIYQNVMLTAVPGELHDDVIQVAEREMWSGIATEIRRMSATEPLMSNDPFEGFRRTDLGYECRASWSLGDPDAHGVRQLVFEVKNLTPKVDPQKVYVPCDEQRVTHAVGQAHCVPGTAPALCLLHGSEVIDLPHGRAFTVSANDREVQIVELTDQPVTCDDDPISEQRTRVYLVTVPGQRLFASVGYPHFRLVLRRSAAKIKLKIGKTEATGEVSIHHPDSDGGPPYVVSGKFDVPVCPRKDPLPTIFSDEFTVAPD